VPKIDLKEALLDLEEDRAADFDAAEAEDFAPRFCLYECDWCGALTQMWDYDALDDSECSCNSDPESVHYGEFRFVCELEAAGKFGWCDKCEGYQGTKEVQGHEYAPKENVCSICNGRR
jgi:hypothetical protein